METLNTNLKYVFVSLFGMIEILIKFFLYLETTSLTQINCQTIKYQNIRINYI